MRKLLVFAVILVAMIAAGWLTFTLRDDSASVNLETREIEEDARRVVEEGAELIERTGRSIDDQTSDSDRATDAPRVPPSSPNDGSAP